RQVLPSITTVSFDNNNIPKHAGYDNMNMTVTDVYNAVILPDTLNPNILSDIEQPSLPLLQTTMDEALASNLYKGPIESMMIVSEEADGRYVADVSVPSKNVNERFDVLTLEGGEPDDIFHANDQALWRLREIMRRYGV